MNSVFEYIRQLNRQSVSLREEWLSRLRHVEREALPVSGRPELVLEAASSIARHDSAEHRAPVTIVDRENGDTFQGQRQGSKPPRPHQGLGEPAVSVTATAETLSEAEFAAVLGGEFQVFAGCDTRQWNSRGAESHDFELATERTGGNGVPAVANERPTTEQQLPPSRIPDTSTRIDRSAHAELPGPPRPHNNAFFESPEVADRDVASADSVEPQARSSAVEKESNVTRARAAEDKRKELDFQECRQPKSIERIVKHILDRFPQGNPTTIVFVGLNHGINVDAVASRIATCLATRDAGEILLGDFNTHSRNLSAIMGTGRNDGLAEVINQTRTIDDVLCDTDNTHLKFLPCGRSEITNRRLDRMAGRLLHRELENRFDYSIMTAGFPGDTVIQRLSATADAVYLLIDLARADKHATLDWINQLRKQAVRIAGIIEVVE